MDAYDSPKEEIKRAADIVELIGQFVQLKKAGRNYVGLCPFHSEKAPSFNVNPERQIYHCFGCKKGGDVLDFWMEYHKVSFAQTLKELAERYHVPLPQRRLSRAEKEKQDLKDSLFAINEAAAGYFNRLLTRSEEGEPGRAYLEKRGISGKHISEFRLGYAANAWNGLTSFFKARKQDLEKAAQAGLLIPKKKGGYYDRFRGRVIFPILDLQQRVTGFGGRVLDQTQPKYLNTPETPIFRKSHLLYGLDKAYTHIRDSGRAAVVEGYTDVLALSRHGFVEAVATLGTALTRDHIRKLKGYAREAVVVFDSDAAGKAAAMKSLPFFLKEGLPSRVMVLPEGDDPDTFVERKGVDGFLRLLEQAVPMFEFYLDMRLAEEGRSFEGKANVLRDMLPMLKEFTDAAQRSLYIRLLSERTGIAESAVLEEFGALRADGLPSAGKKASGERLSAVRVPYRDDLYLANLLIHHPETMARLLKGDFRLLLSDPTVTDVLEAMIEAYDREGKCVPAEMVNRLEAESAREWLREALLTPPIYRSEEEVEQALSEYEDKVHQIKMKASTLEAGKQGDLENLNRILKLKGAREAKPYNLRTSGRKHDG